MFDRVAHPSWIARAPVTRAVPTAVAVVRFMPTCLAMLMLRRDICCWLLGALVHGPVCVLGRDLLNGSASTLATTRSLKDLQVFAMTCKDFQCIERL